MQTLETLTACLAHIAKGAPELPLYYYHVPALTGVDLDMVAFLEQAAERLPSLAGLKYTAHTLNAFQTCLKSPYHLLFGRDELLLSALAVGSSAFIGSTYNFIAPWFQTIWQAFKRGDWNTAQATQSRVGELVCIIHRYGGLPPQKVMMKLAGIDCGPVRLPLRQLSVQEEQTMTQALIGVHRWYFAVGLCDRMAPILLYNHFGLG